MLVARVITGLVFGAVLTATLLFLPTQAVAAVFGLLWLAGAWEWAGFASCRGLGRSLYSATFLVAMAAGWFWLDGGVAVALLAVALVWWLLALGAVWTFPRPFGAGFVGAAGFVVLLPSWLLLMWLHGNMPLGAALSLTLLAVVWGADVGAFGFGRWLGRVKLAPAVSPGKTWEGVTGGVLVAGAIGAAAAWLLGLPVVGLMALGIVTALVSVLGDLTQSMFKRNVGLKDSGTLLPGHGGILDRIDSLTAAVPTFVFGLKLLGVTG